MGLEVERVPGGLPAVGRTVEAGHVPVAGESRRVGDEGGRRVNRAREHEALGERADHLAVGRDGESLQRVREVDEDHGALAHLLDEPLVAALLHDADLARQLASPIVVERPVGELGLVRALDRREEDVLQRASVVGDGDLGQADGQVDTLEQVDDLFVVPDPGDERRGPDLELLERDELHLRREELLEAGEDRRVVDLRLDEPEITVDVHDLSLETIDRNAPAVAVHERDGVVHENDPHLVAEESLDGFLATLLATASEPYLTQNRFILTTRETTPHRMKSIVRSHG